MMTLLAQSWMVLCELAPWLLLGATLSGLLHVVMPDGWVQSHLNGRFSVIKAVVLGVPLPLCSCGVIPAGVGLKKDGASNGAAVGFIIATPQTGVDSIFVAAGFLGWPFALWKVLAALTTGLLGGWLTDALAPSTNEVGGACSTSSSKGWMSGVEHSIDVVRMIWRWLVFGVLLSAILSVYVPPSMFLSMSTTGTVASIAFVLLLSIPLYVCATASVPIAAALVAGGLPLSSALVFLMAGPATNVATLGAVNNTFGKKVTAIYLSTIVAGSVGFALLFEPLFGSTATAVAGHEHGTSNVAMASAVLLLVAFTWFGYEEAMWFFKKKSSESINAPALEIGVEGMSCGGCSSKLERHLNSLAAVQSASVDLEGKKATVHGSLTLEQLAAEVENAGFKPA